MSEQPDRRNENPLEDLADELSESLAGQTVQVSNSSIPQVQGGQVHMQHSSAKNIQASALHMEESAAGFVRSGSVDASESAIGLAIGREMNLDEVTASLLIGRKIVASDVRSILLVAGKVDGESKTIFTPITALIAGMGFALTLLLGGRFLSRILPKRSSRGSAS